MPMSSFRENPTQTHFQPSKIITFSYTFTYLAETQKNKQSPPKSLNQRPLPPSCPTGHLTNRSTNYPRTPTKPLPDSHPTHPNLAPICSNEPHPRSAFFCG